MSEFPKKKHMRLEFPCCVTVTPNCLNFVTKSFQANQMKNKGSFAVRTEYASGSVFQVTPCERTAKLGKEVTAVVELAMSSQHLAANKDLKYAE